MKALRGLNTMYRQVISSDESDEQDELDTYFGCTSQYESTCPSSAPRSSNSSEHMEIVDRSF